MTRLIICFLLATTLGGAAVAATADSILATAAKRTLTPALGGPGGGGFELECEFRGVLVGVHLRFASWLDQIDAICATFRGGVLASGPEDRLPGRDNEPASGGRYGTAGAAIGGDGGQIDTDLMCPQGSVVTGLGASRSDGEGPYAANVALRCTDFATMQTVSINQSPSVLGPNSAGQIPVACKSDDNWYYAAKGLHGRAGIYIDAIGLICSAFRDGAYDRPSDARLAQQAAADARREQQLTRGVGVTDSVSAVRKHRPRTEAAQDAASQYADARVERRRNDAPAASVRHMRPEIYIQGQGSVRLDWCREWASNCGPAAAEAFCRELSPDQPYAADFEMAPDIGRTAIISSRQICTAPSCDGFVHITCVREAPAASPVR